MPKRNDEFIIEWVKPKKRSRFKLDEEGRRVVYSMIKAGVYGLLLGGFFYCILKIYIRIPGEEGYWDRIFLNALKTLPLFIAVFIFHVFIMSFFTTSYKLNNKGLKIVGRNTTFWNWKKLKKYKVLEVFKDNKFVRFLAIFHTRSKNRPLIIALPEEKDKREEIINVISSRLEEYYEEPTHQAGSFDITNEVPNMLLTVITVAILLVLFVPIDPDWEFNPLIPLIASLLPVVFWQIMNIKKMIAHKEMLSLSAVAFMVSFLIAGLGFLLKMLHNMLEQAR
jgi:hypothetical protein